VVCEREREREREGEKRLDLAVIPNLRAVKKCKGRRQILNLQLFYILVLMAHSVIFSQLRVPPNFFSPKGFREPIKVEKH